MGYIGNDSVTQNFTPTVDYFNGNGSTTSFTLSRTVGSAFDVQAFIENVPQNPSSAFTVAGNVITFTSAPPSGTNNIYVRYTSPVTQQVKPAPGTVGTAEISSSVTLTTPSINGDVTISTIGNKVNFATTGSTTVNYIGGASDGYSLELACQRGASQPFVYKLDYANGHIWSTAGSERMRITSAGVTLFGTTNTDVGGSVAGIRLNQAGDMIACIDGSGLLHYQAPYSADRRNTAGDGVMYGMWRQGIYQCGIGATNGQAMTFFTGSGNNASQTERVRVPSTGGLRIACENFANQPSSTNWGIELNNTSASSVFFGQGTGTETHINFGNRNGIRGSIQTNSTNTVYNTTSDYRLKENIAPMTGALAKVLQLKPSTYTWKVNGSAGQGFIAHELQAVIPDCVSGEKDAVDENGEPKYQMVDTSFLVATLTAAIQEQQEIIEDLKARIEVLEAK